MSMEKSVVSVVRVGEDVEAAVREAIQMAGGLEDLIGSKSKVLIKPNICSRDCSGTGKVTDARVTAAVTRIVLERNPSRVVIGEGSAVGYDFPDLQDTMMALEESGTKAVAEKLGVPVVDLNRDSHREVEIPGALVMKTVKIARTVLESDVIVSVPVMKTHIRSAVTLSLKNMKGVLPGAEKRKTHQLGLEQAIADLNAVVKPHFAVVDGLVGMEGLWEYPDDCVRPGLVGAGRDPVALDSVFARIMGVEVQEVMHLQYCQSRGLGVADPERIEVVGVPIPEVRHPFRPAFEVVKSRYPGLTVLAEKACTGCTNEFISTLIYIRLAQQVDRLSGLTVVLGEAPEALSAGKAVVIGKCARKLEGRFPFVPGCPPGADEITQKVCEVCEIDVQLVFQKREELHRTIAGKAMQNSI
jgi:uncharacterized protein (DUF362 family)